MDGVIEGGWNYVWAAYGISWVVLLTYAVSLIVKLNRGGGDDR